MSRSIGKPHAKKFFTHEEDMRLRSLVLSSQASSWETIALMMNGRNARQCKERWMNYLQPSINKQPFTLQEDIMLLQLLEKFGKRWANISKFFNNRTEISLKSRFRLLERRGVNIANICFKHSLNDKHETKKNENKIESPRKIIEEKANDVEFPSYDLFEEDLTFNFYNEEYC